MKNNFSDLVNNIEEEVSKQDTTELEEGKRRSFKGTEYYVTKEQMLDEIQKYKDDDIITDELVDMFLKIAHRCVTSHKFSGYTYKEDFVASGLGKMVKALNNFDMDNPKKNPFGYFSTVMINEVYTIIKSEKRQTMIKEKVRNAIWHELEEEDQNVLAKSDSIYIEE